MAAASGVQVYAALFATLTLSCWAEPIQAMHSGCAHCRLSFPTPPLMPFTLPAAAAEIGMLSSDVDCYFTKVEGDIMCISDAIKVRRQA